MVGVVGQSNAERLGNYLSSVEHTPYKLYEHDCLIFTNRCWKILHGSPWCEEWLLLYAEMASVEDLGYPTLEAAVASRLAKSPATYGSLVALQSANAKPLGYALGICLGDKCAFVGTNGLVYIPTRAIKLSWK